jgi:peptidoglycan pentaglycine glycine transferase (the first glycine)
MLPRKKPQVNPAHWNEVISRLDGAHILQTWEWGEIKSKFGWQPNYLLWYKENGQYQLFTNRLTERYRQMAPAAAALVLQRNINLGGFAQRMGVIYVPKGPLLNWSDTPTRQRVLKDLKDFAHKHSCIFIKIDPDLELGSGIPGKAGAKEEPLGTEVVGELRSGGWHFSDEQVQFRNTVLIDLSQSEESLLAKMKQKTRYNVNLAIRKGVNVRSGSEKDIETLMRMYAETSVRDGFVIRSDAYYREVWTTFMANQPNENRETPTAEALIAEVEGEPVAGMVIFRFAGKTWYLYGMSRWLHRDKMPNYLLQWEAIKKAKAAGCDTYDLWGAPDNFVETDPLWGVYRFKEGLGGTVHRYLGAWDLPLNRIMYRIYSKTLPGLLDIMRKHGKASTRRVIR